MKYRNLGGAHVTAGGLVIKKGETFDSDDPDLCKKFLGKFERVSDDPRTPAPAPASASAPSKTGVANELSDVTADFPDAEEAGLTVKKDKSGWWVYDNEDEVVNEMPLKKKEVSGVVKAYLAE